MARRKYRQYTPGRAPGVTVIEALRDVDLSTIDGRTHLKAGEKTTFPYALEQAVRQYSDWRTITRLQQAGAIRVTQATADGEPVVELETAPTPVVHEIAPSEPPGDLQREREAVARAVAQPIEAPAVPVVEPTPQPTAVPVEPVAEVVAPPVAPTPEPEPSGAMAFTPTDYNDLKPKAPKGRKKA